LHVQHRTGLTEQGEPSIRSVQRA